MFHVTDQWEALGIGLAWLTLVPELIVLIVCWVNRRLSRWMGLVLAGFALSLAKQLWSPAVTLAANLQLIDLSDRSSALLLILIGQAAGLVALLLIATGLALVFRGFRQRLERFRIEILRVSGDKP